MLMRHLLCPLGLSGPITDASWTHSYSKQCIHECFSTSHLTPLAPPTPTLYWPEISVHLEKFPEVQQAASLKISHVNNSIVNTH